MDPFYNQEFRIQESRQLENSYKRWIGNKDAVFFARDYRHNFNANLSNPTNTATLSELDLLWGRAPQLEEQLVSEADTRLYKEFLTPNKSRITKPGFLKTAKSWFHSIPLKKKLLYGGLATGAAVLATAMATKDNKYHNRIEGLHPYSEGLGTQILRQHSDFGSGIIRNKLLKRASQTIKGFSEQEVISLAKAAKTESVEAFAKRMGAEVFTTGKITKRLQKTFQTAGGAFGTLPEEAYSGILGKARKFIHGIRTGGKAGRTYVDPEYFDNEDIIKTAIFHEASEQRNIKAIASKKGWRSVLKEIGEAKSPADLLSHRTTVVQEDLFLRNLTSRQRYQSWIKDFRGNDPFYQTFSARDDSWNTIEGLRHGGAAEDVRKTLTDFGSGYQGLRGVLIAELNTTYQAFKTNLSKEGLGAYSLYEWEHTRGAREAFSRFAAQKENQLKFPAMGDRESFAAHMRGEYTEFKKDFASRWDPLRKIASKIYGKSNQSLVKLTSQPEFKSAVSEALKGEGKLLGRGLMGEARSYAAEMVFEGQTHKFEFVAKKVIQNDARTATGIVRQADRAMRTARTEAFAMQELGQTRAPSFYGFGSEFGAEDSTLIMEKFNLGTPIVRREAKEVAGLTLNEIVEENPLSADELVDLKSFVKSAHKKGITHTDMHAENVVRAINPETGTSEIAVLDWGLANRFESVREIGGTQDFISHGEAMNLFQHKVEAKTGEWISPHKLSEVADMLRIEGYKQSQKDPSTSRLIINSIYHYEDKKADLTKATGYLNNLKNLRDEEASRNQLQRFVGKVFKKQRAITPAQIEQAEKDLLAAESSLKTGGSLLEETANEVSNYILANKPKVSSDALPISDATANIKKIAHRTAKNQALAFADTEFYDATVQQAKTSNNLAATMAHKARRAAIARNRRFEELSRRSVGVGLRQAATATKGHTGFHSNRSTVVR